MQEVLTSIDFSLLEHIWRYELVSVDGESITLRKLTLALLFIILGVILSRVLVRLLARRLLPRLQMGPGAAATLQALVYYFLVFLVFLAGLRFANVPLTIFAVLGGAAALGLGFGSQNLVNNFISGIILMLERPIKPGDTIELEGTFGRVERIGLRSTHVKTYANTHIVVPNSSFLEKNVLNWTLSDAVVRTSITVGVAYGSPTQTVAKRIAQAVQEHGQILKSPEPVVLFQDFGDSALVFEAFYWIEFNNMMDQRRVASDLRFRIDGLFREDGIVIAFPQRDVHLDTTGPIQVQVVEGAGGA